MVPLAVIGGAIGAAVSIVKGISWLSEQLETSRSSASLGGKAAAPSAARSADFEAALTAQVAGQKPPIAATPTVSDVTVLRGPDYDTAARIKAGVLAYSHVGEHHAGRSESRPAGEDQPLINRG